MAYRTVYQLISRGDCAIGCPFQMYSKDVFLSRKAAADHIPIFEARCYDDRHGVIYYAEKGSLRTKILELDLHE